MKKRSASQPHSCGFPPGLLDQPFYGWLVQQREFIKGAFSLLLVVGFSQLAVVV
jgi:hypothetical protein